MTLVVVTKSSFLRFDDAFIPQANWNEWKKTKKKTKNSHFETNDSMHLRCVMYWIFRWFVFVRKFVRISCFRYMRSFSKRMVFRAEVRCFWDLVCRTSNVLSVIGKQFWIFGKWVLFSQAHFALYLFLFIVLPHMQVEIAVVCVHQLCRLNYAFNGIMLHLQALWISVTARNSYGKSSIWGEMSLLSYVTTNSNQVYFVLDFCCESHFLNW